MKNEQKTTEQIINEALAAGWRENFVLEFARHFSELSVLAAETAASNDTKSEDFSPSEQLIEDLAEAQLRLQGLIVLMRATAAVKEKEVVMIKRLQRATAANGPRVQIVNTLKEMLAAMKEDSK